MENRVTPNRLRWWNREYEYIFQKLESQPTMNVSQYSTRNQWELIFACTICDIERATLHNIICIIMLSAILAYLWPF